MLENPKERPASKKFYNKFSENFSSQIVFRTDIFRKLTSLKFNLFQVLADPSTLE